MRRHDQRPEVGKAARWKFAEPEQFWLDNGLHVLLCRRPGQHVAAVCLSLDIPLNLEPESIEGVATIAQRVLDEGTEQHPGATYAESLENIGAVLDGSVGLSASQLFVSVPVARLDEALGLLAEAARTPQLAAADIERHQQLRLAEVEQTLANSAALAQLTFRAACVRRRWRASRAPGGTSASVAAITPAAVREFHADYYRPEGATLIISGDFDGRIHQAVELAFGDWFVPGTVDAVHQVPTARLPHRWLIHRPGAVQADVRLGALGIDRADPRWPDVQVATHAVGGAFLSRLNKVLREELGFTYGVHLVNQPMRSRGLLAVQGSFRTEVVAEAVSRAEKLLDLTANPLTDAEVAQAVTFQLGSSPLRYSTAHQVTENLASLVAAGLTAEFINANARSLAQVTPLTATTVLAELLPADRLTLVVVGDADALAAPLEQAGWPMTRHESDG
jgi:predicted Zn-dependent peptidase